MTSVIWTTPLGLPIVQPYRTTKRKQIMTALQTVYISDPNSPAAGIYHARVLKLRTSILIVVSSEFDEAGLRFPAQLYPQSRCHAHDDDSARVQGAFFLVSYGGSSLLTR